MLAHIPSPLTTGALSARPGRLHLAPSLPEAPASAPCTSASAVSHPPHQPLQRSLPSRLQQPVTPRTRKYKQGGAAVACQAAMTSPSTTNGQLPPGFEERFVSVAEQLADAAAVVVKKYFRAPFDVETKADASPVTIADKQAETAMRDLLKQLVPDHGVFGEEHGVTWGTGAGADFMWVLDPIDGTKSFITGKPLFGTLISLLYQGRPVLGVIDQAILKERWLGVTGRVSTLNGKPIATRACADTKLAYLYATTPHMFSGATEASFNKVRDAVRIPMYGCDCYAYGLLAAGHADLVVEADLKPYDYMALVPIIQGAGGIVTDWTGRELLWAPTPGAADLHQNWPGEVLAAGDARCHAQALKLLDFKP